MHGSYLEARWKKSSHSFSNGNCLEVRQDEAVQVRDSMDPGGPVLEFDATGWGKFLDRIKDGSSI